jgi:peptidyl-prolyl cis-trans isomerase SurA
MKINSILWIMLMVSAAVLAQPRGQRVDGTAAVVGGQMLTISEIENTYEQLKLDLSGQPDSANRCQIFEDQLFEMLLIHHAELDSVVVEDSEVDNMMNRRLDMLIRQVGSQKRLEDFYEKSVVEIKEDMRPLMRNQLIAQKMNGEITKNANVTPGAVKSYFKGLSADSVPRIPAQVEVAQIVVYPDFSQEAIDATVAELNDIRQRVLDGSNFATMAVLYSEDPGSASNGGRYDGVKRGQFVVEFEAVAFALERGEISLPFATEYGYHIVQLLEKRGQVVDLRHILIKPELGAAQLRASEEYLDSIRTLIVDGVYSFEEAAGIFSEDGLTKNSKGLLVNEASGDTKFEMNELDRAVYFNIEGIGVGGVSPVHIFQRPDGTQGYRVLKLVSRTDPHRATLTGDYQLIKDMAARDLQEQLVKKWVRTKIVETFVRVNNYCNCEFEFNWDSSYE